MQRISEINALAKGRKQLSNRERVHKQQEQHEQDKIAGYQQLVELCFLGEKEAARTLANQHPDWGYKIVGGQVMTEK